MAGDLFRDWYLQLENSLTAEAKQAGLLGHSSTIGTAREFLVKRVLASVLPPAVRIGAGKVVNASGSNAWLTILGDRMILSPEGQHGKHGFLLFDSDMKSLRQLGSYWIPPHHTTTAYNGQPLVYPVVDGRIFMRGGDAIYCYDLRKAE